MEVPISDDTKQDQDIKNTSNSYMQFNSTLKGLIGKSSNDVFAKLNTERQVSAAKKQTMEHVNRLLNNPLVSEINDTSSKHLKESKGSIGVNSSHSINSKFKYNKGKSLRGSKDSSEEIKILNSKNKEKKIENNFNSSASSSNNSDSARKYSGRQKIISVLQRMKSHAENTYKDEIEMEQNLQEMNFTNFRNPINNIHNSNNTSKNQSFKSQSVANQSNQTISVKINNPPRRDTRTVSRKEVAEKRRSLIEKRRHSRKKNSDINTFAVADMLKKSQGKSQYNKALTLIKWVDFTIAILITLNIILSIIDNEIALNYSDEYLATRTQGQPSDYILTLADLEYLGSRVLQPVENFLRFLNVFLSITISLLLISHYKIVVNIQQIEMKLSQYDSIWTTGLYKYMILEILICIIFYPPYLNIFITGDMLGLIFAYNVNSIFSIIVMLKLYFIVNIYKYFSRWTNSTAVAICNNYNVKSGIHFAIKAEMKKRPGTVLSALLLISLVLLGFSLRTFEYKVIDPVNGLMGVKGLNDLQNLVNCLWLVIVTMTTVGYGDLYPRSHLGRLVGVISCFVGMLLLSLIIVFLNSMTEFSPEEKKAFSKLKKLFADDNIENKAANVIKNVIFLARLRAQNRIKTKRNFIMEMFVYLASLKKEITIMKNDYKVANSYSLPVDEMLVRLEVKLKDDIEKMTDTLSLIQFSDKDLDQLVKDQEEAESTLADVIKMQEDIAKYMVNLNNEKYEEIMNKKANANPYLSFGNYNKSRRSKNSLSMVKSLGEGGTTSRNENKKKKQISFGTVERIQSGERRSSFSFQRNAKNDSDFTQEKSSKDILTVPTVSLIKNSSEEGEINYKSKINSKFLGLVTASDGQLSNSCKSGKFGSK